MNPSRRRSRISWLCLVAGVLMFCYLKAAGAAESSLENLPIEDIEIHTGPGLDPVRVREHMTMRVGDLYRSRDLREEQRRLWSLGRVRDASIRAERFGKGVRLIVSVSTQPCVTAIEWRGRLGLRQKKLEDGLATKVGEPVSGPLLRADKQTVEARLSEEGYRFAVVTQEVQEEKDGVRVIYHIDAGPRVRVEAIRFEGNRAFTDDELLRLMMTSPGSLFSRGSYDPQVFRNDLETITQFYVAHGWLDAVVGHQLRYDETREHLYPVVRIREGERYQVEKVEITIQGDQHAFSEAEIRAVMQCREGAYFSQEEVDRDVAAIRDLYGRTGRIWTRVEATRRDAPEGPRCSLLFTIAEGREVTVQRVEIRGNRFTKDHVIRRDILLIPGRRADSRALEESRRRLLNTGLFRVEPPAPPSDAVRIRFEPVAESGRQNLLEQDKADVLVEVVEGPKGSLELGGAISSTRGLSGLLAISHHNFDLFDWPRDLRDFLSGDAFAGGGQELTLRLTPGTRYDDYCLAWFDPAVADSSYSLGFKLFLQDFRSRTYDESRGGLSITVGRLLSPDLRLSLTPSWQRIDIRNVASDAAADFRSAEGTYNRSSLAINLDYDRTDSRFFPTRGYRLEGGLTLVGGFLGGDVDVVKERLEAQWYKTVWEPPKWGKHVLHLRTEVAAQQSTNGKVPIFERYWLGSLGSVRGFDWRGIGPVDKATGDHIGGTYSLVTNAEYEIPLHGNVVRGVLFVDAGKLGWHFSDLVPNRLSVGAGFGLRVRILGGPKAPPISFDFGFPIVEQDTDVRRVFSFSIGTGFEF